MTNPILYSIDISPPVQAVRLTAKAISLELEVRDVDLFNGEHLQEPFLKLNPQHTVPVLADGNDVVFDSHAIVTYLVDKYAPDNALYPKDLVIRAHIDQRLHFDSGVLFPSMKNANALIILQGHSAVPQDRIDAIAAALNLLETFFTDNKYLVGNQLTVADFCSVSTVIALDYHVPVNGKYPKISAWLDCLKQLPYFKELSLQPNQKYRDLLNYKKQANKKA